MLSDELKKISDDHKHSSRSKRIALGKMIQIKVAIYLAETHSPSMTEDQKKQERDLWDQYNRAYLQHNPLYYPSALEQGREYERQRQREEAMKQAQLEADEIRDYVLVHKSVREAVLLMIRERRV